MNKYYYVYDISIKCDNIKLSNIDKLEQRFK